MIAKSFAIGESCSAPYVVVPDENFVNQNYFINNSDKTVWFRFTANYSATQVYTCETSSLSPFTHATQIEIFSGSCGSLSLYQMQAFDTVPQGERSIKLYTLSIGQTYYAKITAKKGSLKNINAAFINLLGSTSNVCALPGSILIGGATPSSILISTIATVSMNGVYNNNTPPGFYTFTNQNYFVAPNTTLLIDRDSRFYNCNFFMRDGSKIVIASSSSIVGSLTFDRCYLGGCQRMWEGIADYLTDKITITNSIIEDAIIALDISNRPNYMLHVESTVFNKNLTGIYISSSNVLFTIKNNVFTSRMLYTTIPSLPAVSALKPANINTNSPIYYNNNTTTALLFPNASIKRSKFGIRLINTNMTGNYFTTTVIGAPSFGPAQFNVFDNQDYGIDVTRSKIKIQNNAFVTGDGTTNNNFSLPYSSTGVGIVANGIVQANTYNISVGGLSTSSTNYQPNCFWVLPNPIIFYNFSNISFLNNTIFGGAPSLISPSRNGIVDFNYNKNPNNQTGCDIRFNFSNTFNSTISINNNNFGNVNLVNSTCLISAQNANFGSNNVISISNNFLKAKGTIFLSAVNSSTVTIAGNYIAQNRLSTPLSNVYQYGIRLQGCDHVFVNNNTIIGNINSSFHFNTPLYGLRGITLEQSNECNVNCNYVGNVDQALVFNNNCLTTTGAKEVAFTNEMRDCYQGLVLENFGMIGQQGSATSASDNLWTTTSGWVWNAQGLAINSNSNLSNLFIRNGVGYIPNPNIGIGGNPISLSLSTVARPFCAPCIGPGCLPPASLSNTLEEILQNDESAIDYSSENEWLNKKYVLEKMLFESAPVLVYDSILTEFVDSAKYTNLGAIVETEQLLELGDYGNAKSLSDNLIPENQMEINLQIYNSLYAAWQMNPTMEFTETQINDLNYVANQCYNSGGKAVLQARGFYDYLINDSSVYPDNCFVINSSQRIAKLNFDKILDKNKNEAKYDFISLSPNPVQSSFKITRNDKQEVFSLSIYNVIGELVLLEDHLKSNDEINCSALAKGIYSCRITTSLGKIINRKLVLSPN